VSTPRPVQVEAAVARELDWLGVLELADALCDPTLRTRDALRMRLDAFSSSFRGPRAVRLREEPVTGAYRRAYRQVGLDPDIRPTPLEAAARARMIEGGFRSEGLIEDSLLVALLDTGIPVWALDERQVDGPLTLRQSRPGESPAPGRLVLADRRRPVGELFKEPLEGFAPAAGCERARLYAVTVPGVPQLFVAEALEVAAQGLAGA